MTIQNLLQWGSKQLLASNTSQLDAEVLLADCLDMNRAQLFSHTSLNIPEQAEKQFRQFIKKRTSGYPIAYLTKVKEFMEKEFYIDENVLIPRPETEELVEIVIKEAQKSSVKTLIDLGTGSGCIAISLASKRKDKNVIGIDVSKEALQIAKKNHQRYPLKNLHFLQSDLLEEIQKEDGLEPFCIVANLPYIGTETNRVIDPEVEQFEPHLALFGGKDGLDYYRKTWKQILQKELKVHSMYMEIIPEQQHLIAKETQLLFSGSTTQIYTDLSGKQRFIKLSFLH